LYSLVKVSELTVVCVISISRQACSTLHCAFLGLAYQGRDIMFMKNWPIFDITKIEKRNLACNHSATRIDPWPSSCP